METLASCVVILRSIPICELLLIVGIVVLGVWGGGVWGHGFGGFCFFGGEDWFKI